MAAESLIHRIKHVSSMNRFLFVLTLVRHLKTPEFQYSLGEIRDAECRLADRATLRNTVMLCASRALPKES